MNGKLVSVLLLVAAVGLGGVGFWLMSQDDKPKRTAERGTANDGNTEEDNAGRRPVTNEAGARDAGSTSGATSTTNGDMAAKGPTAKDVRENKGPHSFTNDGGPVNPNRPARSPGKPASGGSGNGDGSVPGEGNADEPVEGHDPVNPDGTSGHAGEHVVPGKPLDGRQPPGTQPAPDGTHQPAPRQPATPSVPQPYTPQSPNPGEQNPPPVPGESNNPGDVPPHNPNGVPQPTPNQPRPNNPRPDQPETPRNDTPRTPTPDNGNTPDTPSSPDNNPVVQVPDPRLTAPAIVRLSVPAVTYIAVNQNVVVDVVLSQPANFKTSAISFDFLFPSTCLRFVGATKENFGQAQKDVTVREASSGLLKAVCFGMNTTEIPSGAIIRLTFAVSRAMDAGWSGKFEFVNPATSTPDAKKNQTEGLAGDVRFSN